MNPCQFYKFLADDTRLKCILLISQTTEACVCDLMTALNLDQPKTSRHLAQLRKGAILQDERRGKWVYYKLHPDLPRWAHDVIQSTAHNNTEYLQSALTTLNCCQLTDNC
ncbi:MAG: metalloregulator ArsR/SmtB family transcription factor [Gammaproteobacteria bacterium]